MDLSITEFIKRPYGYRQFIVIEKDEVIEGKRKLAEKKLEEEKREAEQSALKKDDKFSKATSVVNTVLKGTQLGSVFTLTQLTADYIQILIEKQKKLSEKINVNFISFSNSLELNFPNGHPRENEIYVAHPTKVDVYYPLSEFHKKAFEHKFYELNKVLMSLGAKTIEVEYITSWGFGTENKLEVPAGKAQVEVKSEKSRSIIYKANFKNNDSKFLPEKLSWYLYEPTWQAVGDGRLDHNLQNFNLVLDYSDDYGINMNLFTVLESLGYGNKNSFSKHESTRWIIKGEFDDIVDEA